ncbi:MAG: 4-hydroxythreonine-4-phosphate dehydrogenase PdxA [Acidobacteria bacterium]|nr:4-hydroxythreonine-4-phosphate dehydrogenase PdxA [Acidobacteriota bacterium]
MALPRIGITTGDPAGIGPEVAERAARDPSVLDVCEPVLYATPGADACRPGVVSAVAGRAAYQAVTRAVRDALAARIDAVATGPISKQAWARAGLRWRGHTELLAELTGAGDVRMMFYAGRLSVVLATVHVPLARVPGLLTRERLETTIALAHAELPRFGVARPRLALAGLNPHAGEDGLLGNEERDVFAPVVATCRSRGIDISDPVPADAVFRRAADGEFDAVIACYHDQGLIPIKLMAFGRAVNVTLGLPIVRTSVDHGTGFDIAGTGVADPAAMISAVRLAARLAAVRTPAPVSG